MSLQRGQQVVIPLAVYGPGAEEMEYLIRSAPKAGKLSRVQITSASTATVTYFAPENPTVLEDRFTYAVRTPDGVSAPVPVVITFLEPEGLPPRLVVPGALEVEPIRPGERTSATIQIKNAGGGFAAGEVTAPAPWKLTGSPIFRLDAGDKTEFVITFTSTTLGPHSADITYGPGYKVATTLTTTVLAPVTIAPALLELKAKPGVATRTGQVQISNLSPDPVIIAIKHGGKLLTETSVTVPGKRTHALAVFAEPGEVGPIEERLAFTAGQWSSDIPVVSSALGAIVAIREKSVAFTDVVAGKSSSRNVTLENTGGSVIVLTLNTTEPFRADPASIALKPRSTENIAVLCKAESAGAITGALSITGQDVNLTVPLSADVKAAPPAEIRAAPKPAAPAPAQEPATDTPPSFGAAPQGAEEIPNITGKALDVKPTAAAIEWKSAQKADLKAQIRGIYPSPSGPIIKWRDVPAKFSPLGEMMRCELSSLEPATLQTYRIIAGNTVECTVSFMTPEKPPFLPFGWRGATLGIMIAAAAWMLWRRWKTTGRSGW